jgi:hypothetical protein
MPVEDDPGAKKVGAKKKKVFTKERCERNHYLS